MGDVTRIEHQKGKTMANAKTYLLSHGEYRIEERDYTSFGGEKYAVVTRRPINAKTGKPWQSSRDIQRLPTIGKAVAWFIRNTKDLFAKYSK